MWHAAGMELLQLGANRFNSFTGEPLFVLIMSSDTIKAYLKNKPLFYYFFQHIWRERFQKLADLIRVKLRGQVDPAGLLQPQNRKL